MQTKKVRLYINGERQKDIRPNMTKWQIFIYKVKRFFKVLFWGIVLMSIVIGIFEAGRYLYPAKVYTTQEIIKEVQFFPPILNKISQAESWNSHYCTQKLVDGHLCKQGALGQVLVNNTLDVGKYAINLNYNGKWCADKGYNIFDEKQNEQCALELFYARGSEPWNASKHNWNK